MILYVFLLLIALAVAIGPSTKGRTWRFQLRPPLRSPTMAMTAHEKSQVDALKAQCEAAGLDWSKVFALVQQLLPLILALFNKEPNPTPAVPPAQT